MTDYTYLVVLVIDLGKQYTVVEFDRLVYAYLVVLAIDLGKQYTVVEFDRLYLLGCPRH